MKLFDTTLARLERSLDVRLARHNVLSSNVANVDTPGYTPKNVDFKAAMAAAGAPSASGEGLPTADATDAVTLRVTDEQHLSTGAAVSAGAIGADIPLIADRTSSPSLDGNGVDLDRTMVAMAENGLQYGASARAAGKKLAILRYVASDGNG